jgi:hypothetical protein
MIALLTITVVSVIAALRLRSLLDKEKAKSRRLRSVRNDLNNKLDLAESQRRIAERKLTDYRQTMREQLRLDPVVAEVVSEVANWIEEAPDSPSEPPAPEPSVPEPVFLRLAPSKSAIRQDSQTSLNGPYCE